MNTFLNVGDKLRTVNDSAWEDYITGEVVTGPDYGQIVTVRKIGVEYHGNQWYAVAWFDEFPGDSHDDAFMLYEFELFTED